MKESKTTMNVLELASLYGDAFGVWWLKNNVFPSQIEYRNFTALEDKWNDWVSTNLVITHKFNKTKPIDHIIDGSSLKTRSIIANLITNPEIIVTWNIESVNSGKIEIGSMKVLYSMETHFNFNIENFDSNLNKIKLTEEKKSQVYMVVSNGRGLDLQSFDIDIPEMDIKLNYGEDWYKKHEHLIDILTTKKKKGIALLHGLPGTGKSMYIRHLIASLSENKTVVYLPNQLIPSITDPGFIPLMAEYSGSILVIEDADEAIRARKSGGTTVDKLLNLSDGILSDFLGMQIICTFNSDITSIDDALLRKGRLILKHKFDKLSKENSQLLSDKLGFKTEIKSDMTLAEIYNQEDEFSNVEGKTKIGF